MTDDDFIQAIIENPDDDTPRLAYAEWLSDQRQSDRADFIRIQCVLHYGGVTDPIQRKELVRRNDALLELHRVEWLRPLMSILHERPNLGQRLAPSLFRTAHPLPWHEKYRVWFSRGFVEHVRLSASELLAHATPIFEAAPLLRYLWMPFIQDQEIDPVFRVPQLRQLRGLHLEGGRTGLSVVEHLVACPHVENLREVLLSFFQLDGPCMRALVESPLMRRLTSLYLTAGFGNEEVRMLAECPNCQSLAYLHLCSGTIDDTGVVFVANSPFLADLVCLDLRGEQLGDAGAFALAASPHLNKLRHLMFNGNFLGEEGRRALRTRFGDSVLPFSPHSAG